MKKVKYLQCKNTPQMSASFERIFRANFLCTSLLDLSIQRQGIRDEYMEHSLDILKNQDDVCTIKKTSKIYPILKISKILLSVAKDLTNS